MKKILLIFSITIFLLVSIVQVWAASEFSNLLSDYPYISGLERSMILSELQEAVKLGIDTYGLKSLVEIAKKRKISPLGLKNMVSIVTQAAKLHLYPDFVLSKAKEGLLKRVREDVLVDALEKRLGYLRASELIINSLNAKLSEEDKKELTFIIVQNLENGLSENVITDLINYSFNRKTSLEDVRFVLDAISALPPLNISDDAILKLGEFFVKRKVSGTGIEEVVNAVILSLKTGVPADTFSEFLSGAYRYKNYISLRNAILRFARKNAKINKKKVVPTNTLPSPPAK